MKEERNWAYITRDKDAVVHLKIVKPHEENETPQIIKSDPFWGTIQDCIDWCRFHGFEVKETIDNL